MRKGLIIVAGALGSIPAGAGAKTIVVFVEPMTLEKYTAVIDTPGPDRVLMCMAPPAASQCTEVKRKRR